jgi:hypothetical protein
VLDHIRHVLHIVPNPPIIFYKSRGGLGLDSGYSFEQLFMSTVVQVDFLVCSSHNDSPPFLE